MKIQWKFDVLFLARGHLFLKNFQTCSFQYLHFSVHNGSRLFTHDRANAILLEYTFDSLVYDNLVIQFEFFSNRIEEQRDNIVT